MTLAQSSQERPSCRPMISIVIVNYNSGTLLERCLECLTRQSYKTFEVLLVDNASQDNSLAGVESWPLQLRLLKSETNLGFAAANNRAIQQARGDWVACLNPDAYPQPDWLQELMLARQEYPEFQFFASLLLDASEPNRLDGTGDNYHVSGLAWRRDHGHLFNPQYLKPEEVFAPCAAAALYRRDILQQVGGFDESYFCYFEDVDIAFRLRLLGYRCLFVPDSRALHQGSAITGRRSEFSLYHGHRNLIWTYFKNMPTLMLWVFLPQHLLINLITIIRYTFRGQGRVLLKAKWHGLKGILERRGQRRAIQSSRKISYWQLYRSMSKGLLTPYLKR
ncbi:MAG: glycosyltransferase family 2 protein [Gammaproteobacteria bacterium SHHR-1]